MSLSFEPEPIEIMRQRFYGAMKRRWPLHVIDHDWPELHREHVFDYLDDHASFRLIVASVLPDAPEEPYVHVLARFAVQTAGKLPDYFLEGMIVDVLKRISGAGDLPNLARSFWVNATEMHLIYKPVPQALLAGID